MADKFNTMAEAVKALGDKQALADLNQGYKQRLYRKDRNMKQQAVLEAIANTPELKARIEKEIAAKVKKIA